jgi:LacI family transcriptional regulator
MTTIRDVAARAGVSTATVSRAMNGQPGIRPETRERVATAIRELGYRANSFARGLVTGSLKMVGLILPDISNPFFPALSRGVEDAAHTAGYSVIVGNADNIPDREAEYIGLMHERGIAGLIIVISGLQNALQEVAQKVPIVLVDRRFDGFPASSVSTDHRSGASLATRHLIDRGHRRIAHLGGPSGVGPATERLRGYLDEMESAGLPVEPGWVSSGPFSFESGYHRMSRSLAQGVDVTAVFAADDLLAIGALQACRDRQVQVPSSLAVVGFDDILLARLVCPPLTTILQPAYEMGHRAWDLLLERIQDPAAPVRDVVIQPRLIVRESA